MKLLTLGLATVLLAPSSSAYAHARLESAAPMPNTAVAAPAEVRIWMTQELTLSGNALTVTDAAGNRVDNGDAAVDQTDPNRKQLVATVQPLGPGQYTVTYTASSAEDGHPFTESYTFTVDPAAGQVLPTDGSQPRERVSTPVEY